MPEATPEMPRPGLVAVSDGPWKDWFHFEPPDYFEDYTGPFYCRPEGEGVICGFIPELKNANAGGNIHGGALMTFADYALFMIAGGTDFDLHGVTVTMNCEFVGAATQGRLLTARGEVVRAGHSMIFVRGIIDDADRAVLAYSGTIKRIKPRG
jgi:uncharacterized protein (TIGR00369 family)